MTSDIRLQHVQNGQGCLIQRTAMRAEVEDTRTDLWIDVSTGLGIVTDQYIKTIRRANLPSIRMDLGRNLRNADGTNRANDK